MSTQESKRDANMKAKTKRKSGSGGKRPGAGRPKKEATKRITIPKRLVPEVITFIASFNPVFNKKNNN